MKTIIEVENIMCGGCANAIHKELGTIQGVFGVEVNLANGKIAVEHTDEVNKKDICKILLNMGYSEKEV